MNIKDYIFMKAMFGRKTPVDGDTGGGTVEHTVRFFNESTLLQTVTVPHGGSATYTGETPVCSDDASWAFRGFAPEPTNVTEDMDCYAQYEEPFSLETASWARISEISASGDAANYMNLGDTKSVALKGTMGTLELDETLRVYVLGIDHNSELEGTGVHFGGFKSANGKGICLIDSGYNNLYNDGTKYFSHNHWGNDNYGGWAGCDMRYDILGSTDVAPSGYGTTKSMSCVGYDATSTCATNPVANTLMSCLPADLRAVMKPITKWTNNVGNSGDTEAKVTASVDYLPLLAEFEIFGTRTYANSFEQNHQQQYAYFAAGNSRVKYRHSATGSTAYWWGRSPYCTGSYSFCLVNTGGNSYNHGASYSNGVAPIFLV